MDDKYQERQTVGNSDHDQIETVATVADCCIYIIQGSAPGGHHRKGVLEFPDLADSAVTITLIIKGIASVPERIFEWPVER